MHAPLRTACSGSSAGRAAYKTLAGPDTVWDDNRGTGLPGHLMPDPTDIEALDELGSQLRLSKWRPSTRISYDRWFLTWAAFAGVHGIAVLPAGHLWFGRFITLLACHYASSTVQIAVAAVIAVHRFNDLESPVLCHGWGVTDQLGGLKKNGKIGSKSKKLIVDASFVVDMCKLFVGQFPVWDASLFHPFEFCDPRLCYDLPEFKGMTVACMRGVAVILLGLAVGLRASEVGRLTICCWQVRMLQSVYIHVKEAKNGSIKEEAGGYLYRESGSFSDCYSAISFFEEFWFEFLATMQLGVSSQCTHSTFPTLRCKWCPPLFPVFPSKYRDRPLNLHWRHRVGFMTAQEVTTVTKHWAAQIGRDPTQYSAISFRRGSVSLAAAEKVARNIRQKQCRWKSKGMQDVYTELSVSEALEFGKALSENVKRSKRGKSKSVDFKVAWK